MTDQKDKVEAQEKQTSEKGARVVQGGEGDPLGEGVAEAADKVENDGDAQSKHP